MYCLDNCILVSYEREKMNSLSSFLQGIDFIMAWPLMIYVVIISCIATVAFGFVQFRSLIPGIKGMFSVDSEKKSSTADMSPLQAFVNTLSVSLGNGSVAGMGVAVCTGGPGAVLWVLVFGILVMSVRFAEVYLSTLYGSLYAAKGGLGGPMLYFRDVVGGKYLSYVYAFLCVFFGLSLGNGTQANSIRLGLEKSLGVPPIITAFIILAFVAYVVFGGAARIIKVSDKIVPLKVVVFFASTFVVLVYHAAAIPAALQTIFVGAFNPAAIGGAVLGFGLQQAIQYGMNIAIMSSESGLGTVAILFGSTGSKDPFKTASMGMLTTLLSSIVCFILGLCMVASGVWDSGLNSNALTIASFETVFGMSGAFIVTFLSITFGIGVLVSYAYITRCAYLYVTGGRYPFGFAIIYCLAAFMSALMQVSVVWKIGAIANGCLLYINLFGILYLLPKIASEVRKRVVAGK
jgi:alanine or glycine:cation symporter, AGCS family